MPSPPSLLARPIVLAFLLGACGGRVAPSGEATTPSLEAAAASSEVTDEGGEDPRAVLASACAGKALPAASAPPSHDGVLGERLAGRWLACPEALDLPDPLFGNAAYVGIDLLEGGTARPLLLEGTTVARAPVAWAWSTTGPTTLSLAVGRTRTRVYAVALAEDASVAVLSEEGGAAGAALARVTP